MYLGLVITACILSGIVTIVSFFLYIRFRMHPRWDEGDPRNARLERQEERYQQIHFISLALFVLLGVLILVNLSHRYNPPRINY